jgi:hypothetical protein
MDFLKNFDPTPMRIAKLAAILLAALVVLAVAAQLFAPSLPLSMAPSAARMEQSYGYDGGGNAGYAGEYDSYATKPSAAAMPQMGGPATLSARNVAVMKDDAMMPVPPMQNGGAGADAEEYEVKDYNATIETRKLEQTCAAFTELKAKTFVVFENSNSYETGCSFTFKVEHEHVPEVLAWVKDLDPRSLSENAYTIKKQIEDFTSEEDILKKKLVSIDETLRSAIAAYDSVTRLATQSQDAGSLAQVIDSRISIIERLTQERININSQLDRLSRAKAEQLDRLDYTYFYVSVVENKYVDTRQLSDSWKHAVRDVVRVANEAIQGVTINLIALFFIVLQYALYALILLVIVKYGWEIAVRIWKK